MKLKIIVIITLGTSACASLEPNTVPIELTHVSHASQHLESHPTNYGYNALNIGVKWTPLPGLSLKVEEGLVLDSTYHYQTQDNGRQPMHGDMLGPREIFTAAVVYEFQLK